jgi:hypothetical protein
MSLLCMEFGEGVPLLPSNHNIAHTGQRIPA